MMTLVAGLRAVGHWFLTSLVKPANRLTGLSVAFVMSQQEKRMGGGGGGDTTFETFAPFFSSSFLREREGERERGEGGGGGRSSFPSAFACERIFAPKCTVELLSDLKIFGRLRAC